MSDNTTPRRSNSHRIKSKGKILHFNDEEYKFEWLDVTKQKDLNKLQHSPLDIVLVKTRNIAQSLRRKTGLTLLNGHALRHCFIRLTADETKIEIVQTTSRPNLNAKNKLIRLKSGEIFETIGFPYKAKKKPRKIE